LLNLQLLDRILAIANLATSIHNAYYLSTSILQSLFSLVGNFLTIFGIKKADGQPYEVGEIVAQTWDSLGKSLFGAAQWTLIKAQFKIWSRIYQSAMNIFNAVRSIGQSVLSALEVVGSMTGKIGNSLRGFGVVGERAFNWFNPQPNFQNRFFTTLEAIENVFSNIDSVASEVLSIQETVSQINENNAKLQADFSQATGHKTGVGSPEAAVEKASRDEGRAVSQSVIPEGTELKPVGD
jgi:uncharacterized protein YoxC